MNRVGKIVPPKRQILKDISLSFFPGAKIGVLGLNGSGKSTCSRSWPASTRTSKAKPRRCPT
jgi:ATPase subunit of ABC transporter with duplicated ATPase domains